MLNNDKKKFLGKVILLLALGGLIDASYLTMEHLLGVPVVCGILDGCEKVLTSDYSTIGKNFPVAALGIIYYGILVSLAISYLESEKKVH